MYMDWEEYKKTEYEKHLTECAADGIRPLSWEDFNEEMEILLDQYGA